MQEYKELIKTIRHRFDELPSLKEENIKTHIVVNLFLKEMGFDSNKWDYEETIYDGRADIAYIESGKPIFLVEVKGEKSSGKKTKQNMELSESDLNQICDYLNKHESKIVWGLLTNGRRYILINNRIYGKIPDKVVFDISIDDRIDEKLLKYFSYKHLFDDMTTNYFADIAQFKAYHVIDETSRKNWNVYKCALNNFFDFYAEQHPYKSIGKGIHEPLSQITVHDFKYYMENRTKKYNGKQTYSKKTIQNNYSYICAFFTTLAEHEYITSHNFTFRRNQVLSKYDDTPKIKATNFLTEDRYSTVLNYLCQGKYGYRNTAIFLLCAYHGFERSDVSNLIWNDIDLKKETICYSGKCHKMTKLIKHCFEELNNERINNKIKLENVFITYNNNKYRKADVTTINRVFSSLEKLNSEDEAWKMFSPQYVRECLIYRLFENGYSIEQIAYYVGADAIRVIGCIPNELIISEGKKRLEKNIKQVEHPFANIVDKFYNSSNIKL